VSGSEESYGKLGRLEVQDTASGGRHRLGLVGELDLASAPDLEATIERICTESSRAITLDLRRASWTRQGCTWLRPACMRLPDYSGPPHVQRIFELTRLVDMLPFQAAA
jgi:hypothetical protein